MKQTRAVKSLAFLILMMMLLSSVSTPTQANGDDDDSDDEEHEPEYERDDEGTVWIQTSIMSVVLDSRLPSYQYWYTPDTNGSLARFRVAYLMVVEFEDANGDGVYQINETLQFAPLEAFDWSLVTGEVKDGEGRNTEVYASYVKGGLSDEDWDDDWFKEWMPGYKNGESALFSFADDDDDDNSTDDDMESLNLEPFEGMTMRFYAHIYMDDYNGTVTDDEGIKANYTVAGGVELKVDVEIGNFPYLSNTSKVAVLNYLQEDIAEQGANYLYELEEEDGEFEIDSDDEWEISDDLGEKFEDREGQDIQELAFVEATTNTTRGFYRWVDKAVMTLPNGSSIATDVAASYWADGTALLLFLAYANFDGGSIVHDPSMRFLESASPVPITPTQPETPVDLSTGILFGAIGMTVLIVVIWQRKPK